MHSRTFRCLSVILPLLTSSLTIPIYPEHHRFFYMGLSMLLHSILAGSRARYIEKLAEGDMVAWGCLIGGIVLTIGISIIKKKMSAPRQ
jgi:hypothetical protein